MADYPDPDPGLSWVEQQLRSSWRFRWGYRWESLKLSVGWCWTWIRDELVWNFDEDEPRLMRCRTKTLLNADDPRHFE